MPISIDAISAPDSEPRPPTTTTTNTIGPIACASVGCVRSMKPPMTPAKPASALPTANTRAHTHDHNRSDRVCKRGWREKHEAADDPGQAGKRAANREHESENARNVVTQ